jgi:Protein of unknown function (DUF1203)
MQSYRVVAVGSGITDAVRRTLRSPGYGHPAHTEVAAGYGPCRQCLRDFVVGQDRRILFTYDAFNQQEKLPLPGPVFIHETECVAYPEDGGFPADLRARPLTLNAYASGRRLVAQKYVSGGDIDSQITQLLQDREVSYIHVRDTVAGCYDFRIERMNDEKVTGTPAKGNGGISHE